MTPSEYPMTKPRFVILLCPFLLFLGCRHRPTPESTTLPDQVIEEFRLHESQSGRRLYTLEAERALVYENEQRSDVVQPKVLFYDEGSRIYATLWADSGTIYSRTEDLMAKGRVRVVTADSTVLVTDSLAYNNRKQVVRTNAPVLIQTPEGTVSGQGLISDPGLMKIEVLSAVKGTSQSLLLP